MKIVSEKLRAWVAMARLHFFPMTWIAYTAGAAAQAGTGRTFDAAAYLLGYLILFLIELCAIFVNECYDFETDRINRNYSPFTGGSRVLVEGRIRFGEVKRAVRYLLILIVVLGVLLAEIAGPKASLPVYLLIAAGLFLALGYTMPPLKFCYRCAGEVVVGLSHSAYMIVCGFVFQGGDAFSPVAWLLAIPLFLAILGAIILAGLPDRQADASAGKRTVAVAFGSRSATVLSMIFVAGAFVAAASLAGLGMLRPSPAYWIFIALPHGLALLYVLLRLLKSNAFDRRIDGIMILSLSYIVWFGLLPLLFLL